MVTIKGFSHGCGSAGWCCDAEAETSRSYSLAMLLRVCVSVCVCVCVRDMYTHRHSSLLSMSLSNQTSGVCTRWTLVLGFADPVRGGRGFGVTDNRSDQSLRRRGRRPGSREPTQLGSCCLVNGDHNKERLSFFKTTSHNIYRSSL